VDDVVFQHTPTPGRGAGPGGAVAEVGHAGAAFGAVVVVVAFDAVGAEFGNTALPAFFFEDVPVELGQAVGCRESGIGMWDGM
jgi:hypothetical protein